MKHSDGLSADFSSGPRKAVIDIGSNTVRLVIFGGARRAPVALWNEKVTAKLGQDLPESGQLGEASVTLALAGLARYARMLKDLGIKDVETVATAASRDAANGAQFLEEVRKLGLKPRLLSGEDEARMAAMGVLCAFPQAEGVVADLGGGSLELAALSKADCSHACSLPIGTLRLASLRSKGPASFEKAVTRPRNWPTGTM